ncbi:MAG: 50S ribosomal protein L10 [Alphaproteobacteria bacterium]
MHRSQKQEVVAALKNTLEESQLVIVTQQTGLTVAEVTAFRRDMHDAGAGFKVTKNRLAKLALAGSKYASLEELFTGPTAIAYSKDPVAAAKVAVKFSKENDKLQVIGGALDGQVLSLDELKNLASLPSLDELRGKIVGVLQAPAGKLARLTQEPGGQLARVFGAYGAQA